VLFYLVEAVLESPRERNEATIWKGELQRNTQKKAGTLLTTLEKWTSTGTLRKLRQSLPTKIFTYM
jgi:hypothetical protein